MMFSDTNPTQDYKAIRIFQRQPMNVYPSEKVLGRMFRTIDPEPVFEEADGAFSGDPRLISLQVSIDYEHYLIAAGQHKAQYEFGLMGLLRRSELVLWSPFRWTLTNCIGMI